MSDNSPIALILPTDYNSFIKTSDDYYNRWEIASVELRAGVLELLDFLGKPREVRLVVLDLTIAGASRCDLGLDLLGARTVVLKVLLVLGHKGLQVLTLGEDLGLLALHLAARAGDGLHLLLLGHGCQCGRHAKHVEINLLEPEERLCFCHGALTFLGGCAFY